MEEIKAFKIITSAAIIDWHPNLIFIAFLPVLRLAFLRRLIDLLKKETGTSGAFKKGCN